MQIMLSGDRPTGPLHIGHYIGSLKNRVALQDTHQSFVLIADAQALTDNMADPGRVCRNIQEVALDYLAVGIDPAKTTICVQSCLPALADISLLYLNLVSVARLERNPTVKEEIRLRGLARDIPAGFLCYPVAQAADITAFKATVIPVGQDQMPMIEQTNEIVRRVNRQAGVSCLPEAVGLLSATGRLPGVDGQRKMGKSQNNAIPLSASPATIHEAVQRLYTDAGHIRISDPGRVEGNAVFAYLDAFDEDKDTLEDLKAHYRRGGLADRDLKQRLETLLQELIEPIRERRLALARDPAFVHDVLQDGTQKAQGITQATAEEIRSALGLFRFSSLQEPLVSSAP